MKDIKILHQFDENNTIHIIAESTSEGSCCPRCGTISKSKHSKYTRKLSDGSLEGFSKNITIIVRKFKCRSSSCSQKIFTERLPFAAAYARMTNKAIELITFLALTISAENLSCIMKKLGISISHNTILRLIRKLPKHTVTIDDSVKNIGIDDFAFKKRKKYCTLICDMDKRIILDILPSRNKEAVADWLKKYPQIKLVSRDGSISYAGAITEALPNALQVSDKFHLVKNLIDNINRYVKRKYPKNLVIPKNKEEIVDAVIEDKNNLKAAIRDEKIKAKWAFIKEIKDKHQSGVSIRGLAREYSMSKNTIKGYLKSEKSIYWPQGIKRGSELDKYKSYIIKLLKQCKTHKEILHEISKLGYKGSLSYLSSYMSKNGIKRASVIGIADSSVNTKTNYIINSSLVIKAICKNSENLSNTDVDTLRILTRTFPELIDLKGLIDDFKSIFKGGSLTLETWISKAKDFNISELSSYISGIENDIASVKNSISSKYNNGLLEGMVNKVKAIKRTSYGRCNFDLLRSKILHSQAATG